jgi:hypothetical protein
MRNQKWIIVIALALVVIVPVGWYLASPLFIDNTVDEAFPFEIPDETVMETMSDADKVALEVEFMAAVPDAETVSEMPAEMQEKVEEMVLEAAATVMMDHEMDDPMPEAAEEWMQVASGVFAGVDAVHQGSGMVAVYQLGDEIVLRFEDFEVTNGPDLHVILTKNPNPRTQADVGDDYIDLGSLKGNIGSQNYEVPAGIDLSAYQGVVIYCVPFHVVFATAPLSS